ncbi:ATP-binding protein [Arthrobacter sp. I2-34]|uniref:ATP-binding protein n=1 Tax=Arthrobacter hankyongi TaxID=2904801 RepID=A0ABS9LDH9_9MICC|nr:ATP-binding protein [Arthrobacter hankyongi]MCG2624737.1 ATP-binding protein [Arthrobacter hankyongi]
MIERIRIRGYRKYVDFMLKPNPGMNIIVGGNESGKSTLLEAISLALTGRVNGRSAQDELNPHWFNTTLVSDFFEARKSGQNPTPPEICIEIFLADDDDLQRLSGAANSDVPPMHVQVCRSSSHRIPTM